MMNNISVSDIDKLMKQFFSSKKELKNYREGVFAFLDEKGYMPNIGDDNRIEFTYRGKYMNIDIDSTQFGCYVRMYLIVLDTSSAPVERLNSNINEVNKIKRVVKVFYEHKFIVVEASFFSMHTSDFERTFDLLVESIYQSFNEVIDIKSNQE